ncbi:MAG: hypothetical protein KJ067_18140 [Vicinamibacteria bacterium]|nr:hypothetical protein [Vicinamibacteria bacterium]
MLDETPQRLQADVARAAADVVRRDRLAEVGELRGRRERERQLGRRDAVDLDRQRAEPRERAVDDDVQLRA